MQHCWRSYLIDLAGYSSLAPVNSGICELVFRPPRRCDVFVPPVEINFVAKLLSPTLFSPATVIYTHE